MKVENQEATPRKRDYGEKLRSTHQKLQKEK